MVSGESVWLGIRAPLLARGAMTGRMSSADGVGGRPSVALDKHHPAIVIEAEIAHSQPTDLSAPGPEAEEQDENPSPPKGPGKLNRIIACKALVYSVPDRFAHRLHGLLGNHALGLRPGAGGYLDEPGRRV